MPESPLVQKETVALTDLETLVAARSKGETETELGFRKRIEREEAEYKAAARQLAGKFKVDSEALEAEYARRATKCVQTFQRTDSGGQGRVRPDQETDRRAVQEGPAPGQESQGRSRLAGAGVL